MSHSDEGGGLNQWSRATIALWYLRSKFAMVGLSPTRDLPNTYQDKIVIIKIMIAIWVRKKTIKKKEKNLYPFWATWDSGRGFNVSVVAWASLIIVVAVINICYSPAKVGPHKEKLRRRYWIRPRAVTKTEGTFPPNTDRPWLANDIFIFFLKPNKWLRKEPKC